jgi:alanyl-tRNA synthetase
MEKLSLNTLREEYLKFFESKGHLRLKSFSLVPENDPSILLINAGMTPLKPYFTGALKPPSLRVTTCQKCIRTLDIDRVGITSRHGTFFEMLGNFSFGDYFKKEAISWSWEFFTEVLKMPKERLYVSVYNEDDEAYDIWHDIIGLPEDHIVRLGKEDNFWEHGTGPCGPCSEIHYDRGPEKGCGKPDCKVGCDCDRYIEVWNNVFTQFDKQPDGTYKPLAKKNIDTGMGLERLACVMQGVDSLFEVDTIKEVLDTVCKVTDTEYGKSHIKDISIRVITDHIRSSVMMISDGIIPSNEGRGYVLRRLLRRAARHGKLLGVNGLFLADLTEVVIKNSKGAYPELGEKSAYIWKVVDSEEQKFASTIESGMSILNEYLQDAKSRNLNVLEGEKIFKLHDTYGFPYDLTREIATEQGFGLDKDGFDTCMKNQKDTAREAQKVSEGSAWKKGTDRYKNIPRTVFTGYEKYEDDACILDILPSDDQVQVVLDKTPFYAESGGQQADKGIIQKGDSVIEVTGCVKNDGIYVHTGKILKGEFNKGDKVRCILDIDARKSTERNHSATHMLQAALREVLGEHVHQAGSYVDSDRLRFDFTHFQVMTDEEIRRVQKIVNNMILSCTPVKKEELEINEAKKRGAIALFSEKYGNIVRVITMGDFSMELCGGTHLDNSGETGLFKIISESGVAAGVRRIEAVTGTNAMDYFEERENLIKETEKALRTNDILGKAVSLQKELKDMKHENENLVKKLSSGETRDILDSYEEINGVKVIAAKITGADMNRLREMADKAREKYHSCVCALIGTADKANIVIAATSPVCKKGIHAGKIIKEVAAVVGGAGGGREDMAQAGGKDIEKADEALEKAKQIIRERLING